MTRKVLVTALMAMAVSGCWNGGNTHLKLGNVSVGQQLIDLKRALDEGAMTETEYTELKTVLMSLSSLCESASENDR